MDRVPRDEKVHSIPINHNWADRQSPQLHLIIFHTFIIVDAFTSYIT
jgi:hypothetical protein